MLEKKLSPKFKSFKLISHRDNGTKRVQTFNEDPSKTDQSIKDSTDINKIISNYEKHGIMPRGSVKKGLYDDISDLPKSLTEAAILIRDSELKFATLPSHIREKFNNQPHLMINFLEQPQNHEEAVKLGLLTKKEQKNDNSNDDQKAPQKNKAQQKMPPLQKNSVDPVDE